MDTHPRFEPLRAAAYDLANAILTATAYSTQQQYALRKVREALSMAISGEPTPPNQVSPPAAPQEESSARTPKKGDRGGGRRRSIKKKGKG